MTDSVPSTSFQWHPMYKGLTFAGVESKLELEIARDQRQYQLALDGAEQSEHESLSSIVELEKTWGSFAFDWAEMDPKVLADRVMTFEKERERRQDMISFADYRASGALVEHAPGTNNLDWREKVSPRTLAVIIGVAIIILIFVIGALL